MEELLNSVKCYLVWRLNILWCFLRNLKLEYLSLFICLNWVIAAVKLIFGDVAAVLGSEAGGIRLLGLLWVTWSHHFFPFYNRILCLVAEKENTALTTGQVGN